MGSILSSYCERHLNGFPKQDFAPVTIHNAGERNRYSFEESKNARAEYAPCIRKGFGICLEDRTRSRRNRL